ncbi:MAG: PAS domain-containing protein [Alphaproteobacteria bacterium]|nr:PAS domain-containing protein [Alphaproteobacteria bacterium]
MRSIPVDRVDLMSIRNQALYNYWLGHNRVENEACNLPHFSVIDPIEIPKICLSNITLLEIARDPFDIRVRLSGTMIERYHERSQRGKRLLDVSEGAHISEVFDWYQEAANKKVALWSDLKFVTDNGALLNAERVALPFVDDQGDVCRILSCIEFSGRPKGFF